ncbi:uncharacterized protein LOC113472751, partial [Diaphorina citri]|uniref:Uncharacterized protein LOC113472751 n=1 Tax=Diaphorina citri TaxID=121845 RepID=A0A3Q0JIY1_DIACI
MRSAEEAPDLGADPGEGRASGQRREMRQTSRRAQPEQIRIGNSQPSSSSIFLDGSLEEPNSHPRQNRRRQWSRQDRIDIMKAYYIATSGEDEPVRGFMRLMQEQWSTMRPDLPLTAVQLNNQKNTIMKKNWFTAEELEVMKAEVREQISGVTRTEETEDEDNEPNDRNIENRQPEHENVRQEEGNNITEEAPQSVESQELKKQKMKTTNRTTETLRTDNPNTR